jgi:hypothetical protein
MEQMIVIYTLPVCPIRSKAKSTLTLLCQRRELKAFSPFEKEPVLSLSKEGFRGI